MPDQMVSLVPKAQLVILVPTVTEVLKVHLDPRVVPESRDTKVHPGLPVQMDLMDKKEQLVQMALQVPLDHLVHQVVPDVLEMMVQMELSVTQVRLG